MCGRFAQVYDDTKILNKFRLEDISERIQPKFNMSPGMKVNAVMAEESTLKLIKAEWGFSEINGNLCRHLWLIRGLILFSADLSPVGTL
jgi:putative SOS response-associated peptidase YedK